MRETHKHGLTCGEVELELEEAQESIARVLAERDAARENFEQAKADRDRALSRAEALENLLKQVAPAVSRLIDEVRVTLDFKL